MMRKNYSSNSFGFFKFLVYATLIVLVLGSITVLYTAHIRWGAFSKTKEKQKSSDNATIESSIRYPCIPLDLKIKGGARFESIQIGNEDKLVIITKSDNNHREIIVVDYCQNKELGIIKLETGFEKRIQPVIVGAIESTAGNSDIKE